MWLYMRSLPGGKEVLRTSGPKPQLKPKSHLAKGQCRPSRSLPSTAGCLVRKKRPGGRYGCASIN